ncbi:MAG: hypothetical protein J7498_06155 [Sphingobium sp.]|nr:hypothetical protein [Sphingobium sp.]
MVVVFLMAASAVASAKAATPPPAQTSARKVIEAQLQSPPRQGDRPSLNPDEADAIYKRYIASIGQRPDRAPDSKTGGAP